MTFTFQLAGAPRTLNRSRLAEPRLIGPGSRERCELSASALIPRASKPTRGDDLPDESPLIPDALPLQGADTDWRDFRRRLIASQRGGDQASTAASSKWAHSIPEVEKGCLLVANPFMFLTSQQYFRKSVILIIDHNEEGSYGVILNKPTMWKMGEVQGADALLPEFANNYLNTGGDVGKSTLLMLHCVPGARDAKEIVRDVWMGGLESVKKAATEGKCSPLDDVRFYLRYAGWSAGQLQGEVASGVWHPIAASKDVIFSDKSKEAMWEEVLGLCGGELAALAEASRPSLNKEIMGVGAAESATINLPTPEPGVPREERDPEEAEDVTRPEPPNTAGDSDRETTKGEEPGSGPV